jgi:nitrosocyanin
MFARLTLSAFGALALLGCSFITAAPADAGEVNLTVVNIETPQGVKVWVPESIFANEGDTVTLRLINKLDQEHGYKIEAFGIEKVVAAESAETVSFKADKDGIFPINCHLHPPHVAGQLVVLDD